MENEKKWYKSKTLWVNAIAIAAIIIQSETGYVVSPEIQVLALGVINVILRKITKEKIVWKA